MKLSKKLLVFFGDKGLSQSEANHQANMAKEIANSVSRILDSMSSCTEVMKMDGEVVKLDQNKELPADKIAEYVKHEAGMYALSAWLREAVKAKTLALEEIKYAETEFFEEDGDVVPTFKEPQPIFNHPVKPKAVTEADVVGDMSVKERSEYLMLEARAAHIGKRVHTSGTITKVREDIESFVHTRFVKMDAGAGKKDFPVTRTPLYDPETINGVFFNLQKDHREAEQKLNGYKARIHNEVTLRNATLEKEYAKAFNDAKVEHDVLMQEWNTKYNNNTRAYQQYLSTIQSRRLEATKTVAAWKIVIPHELESTLEYVKSYTV